MPKRCFLTFKYRNFSQTKRFILKKLIDLESSVSQARALSRVSILILTRRKSCESRVNPFPRHFFTIRISILNLIGILMPLNNNGLPRRSPFFPRPISRSFTVTTCKSSYIISRLCNQLCVKRWLANSRPLGVNTHARTSLDNKSTICESFYPSPRIPLTALNSIKLCSIIHQVPC